MRLLMLGTGFMAGLQAPHFARIEGVELVGCVDVDQERADAFADTHNIPNRFASLDEALAWGAFDAVTNMTTDRAHHPTTMALLQAGKPVFCEKPLAENYRDAIEMTETAEQAGLVNMVNLTYRNSAPLQRARAMVLDGTIGGVKHIEASYLQSWLVSKAWGDWRTESRWLWRLSRQHGSNGVLGDVGIHILDFASYGAAVDVDRVFCRLKAFDKAPGNRIGEYDLDANDSFTMSVEFNNGALGVVHASRWATGHLNELRLRIFGDKGGLEVIHAPDGSTLRVCLDDRIDDGHWRQIDAGTAPTNYQRFAEAVRTGRNGDPTFRHAANLQKVLDLAIAAEDGRKELVV
jgi:predicted dehydrogenase